ncbi:leucine--tRNA ligase, mitochondrial-like [Saccoglossus kowalevskii]|uniref:leucine--tRNA ligase n=1 Tax=Saccoglossus kowalevskii TaxID=10224 RepID=A0ABM0MQB0_SACKO|nr:PREDICTED: probable leucine--tRNA ligase, mitochondrial-like [Saccoglossus kowalevskii]
MAGILIKHWRKSLFLPSTCCRCLYSKTGIWEKKFTIEQRQEVEDYWKQELIKHNERSRLSQSNKKEKFYVLSMFPYPSGRLHMGHVRVYTISDTVAHFQRMNNKQVLHPMGWDAFGLPAENAAIERKLPPEDWTYSNIDYMRKQLQDLSMCFDWDREIFTCREDYYKWTQYIFLQFYESGLAYQKLGWVNWDPIDQTVLANEQINNNILDELSIYTDVPELIFGASHIILSPQHIILHRLQNKLSTSKEQLESLNETKVLKLDLAATHPFTKKSLPVFVANDNRFTEHYDALIGIPSGCQDDMDFALTHDLKIVDIFTAEETDDGIILNSDQFSGMTRTAAKDAITKYAREHDIGGHMTSPRQFDWFISRQRYWGTPIPIIHCPKCKKDAYKKMRGTEANKVRYKRLKKQAKKVVAKAMRGENEKVLSELKENPNKVVKAMKGDGRDVTGGRCMRGSDGKLNFSERDRSKVWKEHMEKIMNEENEWDQDVEADLVEGPVERVSREEVVKAIRDMKTGKAAEPSEWSKEKGKAKEDVEDASGGGEWEGWDEDEGCFKSCKVEGGAIMHLLYARFIAHFLHHKGLTRDREPFKRLLVQGLVMGQTYKVESTGQYLSKDQVQFTGNTAVQKDTGLSVETKWEKMSKSKHNGVDPEDIINQYGIDTVRLFMLSGIPPEHNMLWNTEAIVGIVRWKNKLWDLVSHFLQVKHESPLKPTNNHNKDEMRLRKERHVAIEEVTRMCKDEYMFSVSISRLIKLTNILRKVPDSIVQNSKEFEKTLCDMCIMLAPMAPHIALELWEGITSVEQYQCQHYDRTKNVLEQTWPELEKLEDETPKPDDLVTMTVKINNEFKGHVSLPYKVAVDKDEAAQFVIDSDIGKEFLHEKLITRTLLAKKGYLIGFLVK